MIDESQTKININENNENREYDNMKKACLPMIRKHAFLMSLY